MKQASVLFLSALILLAPISAMAQAHKPMARPVPCHPKAQGWIGKHFAEDGRVAAPGDITPSMLPAWNRVIRPGEAVTRDFIENRLNLYLDAQGIIVGADCG